MRLTRRDALAALATTGVVVSSAAELDVGDDGSTRSSAADRSIGILVAAAEVLYPAEVEGIAPFVERFFRGRAEDRPEHLSKVVDAAEYLDDYALAWYDEAFVDLDRSTRDEVLRRMGADTASPDPDGSDVQRVRYYVVNELLFALYASPTGGELLGIENPQGHPGGTTSYQRGPGS